MTISHQQPIIILGMHRSGTSLLSRILEKNGFFWGCKKESNYEALYFHRINEWLLRQAHATWDNPYNFRFINSSFINRAKGALVKQLKSPFVIEYLGFKGYIKHRTVFRLDCPWGWKDPRNTFTYRIWKELFPQAKVIHIYRNPIDVAQSLKVRAAEEDRGSTPTVRKRLQELFIRGDVRYAHSCRVLNIDEGIKLWREYVTEALSLTSGKLEKTNTVMHIKYEDVLDDPYAVLEKVFTFLETDFNCDGCRSILETIDPGRKYAFLNDSGLRELHSRLQSDRLLRLLGYDFDPHDVR